MEEKIFISLTKDELQSIIIESVSACLKYSKHILNQESESDTDEWLNVKQVAEYLGLTKPTIYDKAQRGEIPNCKRAGRLYFSKKEIDEWIRSGSVKTAAEIKEEADRYIQGIKKGGKK